MKYNELTLKKKAAPKRAGRGIAAGRGKTAGRGTKGQGARKSGNVRPGFEGGQMPLVQRLPKLRGFKSKRTPIEVVYTGQIEALKKAAIDNQVLFEAGLISSPYVGVKLLLNGDLKSKKTIKLQNASKKAAEAVTKAGGGFTKIDRVGRPAKKSQKTKE
jgi:large subunit ribosomal protein L15